MKRLALTLGVLASLSATAAATTVSDDVQIAAGETLTIDVASGDTATYSGVISGEGGVKKTGTGTLVLSGANTFSGGFNLVEGKVRADSEQAFGTAAVTNSATVSGTQFIFNVDGGVFENQFLLLGSKTNGSGDYPTLYFQKNTTLNGDVTLAMETNFGNLNSSSIVVNFYGRILGGANILYKIYGNAHFRSAVAIKGLYSGVVDSSSGWIHLYSRDDTITGGVILRKGSVRCHGENVLGGSYLSMRSTLGGTEATFIDMNGFDQTVSHIISSASPNPSIAALGGKIKSDEPAVLTIAGMNSGSTFTSYYGVDGKVSVVLDVDATSSQRFDCRTSTTTGSLEVKSGVFEITGTATFRNVPAITVGESGTFLLNSGAEAALSGLKSLKVDGRFSVGGSCLNPFGEFHSIELGDNAELVLPDDMVLFVDSLKTNGVELVGRIASGDLPQLKSGSVIVKTPTSENAWVGGGENESIASAANWDSEGIDLLGGMNAVFASSEAVGFRACVDQDAILDHVDLSSAAGFEFYGESVLSVKGGIAAERPDGESSPVYSFQSPVDFMRSQTLSVSEGTTVRFSGGISADGRIGKTGAGKLELSGSNVWDGALIVSNGAIDITGTITTSRGVDGSVISGKDADGALSLHMSPSSGASANHYLTVSNAVIEKPIWFAMGEHSSSSFFIVPAATTNVFRGFFHSADEANQRFWIAKDAVVVFEGGGKLPWNFYQAGIGTVYFRSKPFTTSFGNASHYYALSGGTAGVGTAVFEVGGNSMKWLTITGDGGNIDMRVDNVLDADSSIKMTGYWISGRQGSVLKLNDTFQTVGCISANCGGSDCSWIEGSGATLYLTNNVTTRNSICAIPFKGDVSLKFDSPGTMMLTNAISSSCGRLEVERGTVTLAHDAAWTNVSEVAVSGDGRLVVDAQEGVRAQPVFGKEATLSFADNGVLDIADGISVRVKHLFVGGVKMPRGVYGYSRVSDENVRKHFASDSTGVVSVRGEGSFTVTIR